MGRLTKKDLDPLWPLFQPKDVVQLISEVTGQPIEKVAPYLLQEFKEVGSNVSREMIEANVPFHRMTPKMEEFYRVTNAFVYETTVSCHGKFKDDMQVFMLNKLKEYGKSGGKVFCFGDGLGFESARLAQHGYEVSYNDPGEVSVAYAKQVFARNKTNVKMLAELSEIEEGSLDAVVSFDVLEHCDNPHEIVQLWRKWLKPDGVIIVHASFWMIMSSHPTHLEANRHLTATWRKLYDGFEPLDAAFVWCPIAFQKKDSPNKIRRTWFMWLCVILNQIFLWPSKIFLLRISYFLFTRYILFHHNPKTVAMYEMYSNEVVSKRTTSNGNGHHEEIHEGFQEEGEIPQEEV